MSTTADIKDRADNHDDVVEGAMASIIELTAGMTGTQQQLVLAHLGLFAVQLAIRGLRAIGHSPADIQAVLVDISQLAEVYADSQAYDSDNRAN